MKNLICEWCNKCFQREVIRRFCSIGCATSKRMYIDEPDFFSDENVSDEFKGYFAGLFWADGCYSNNNGLDRITLSMSEQELMSRIHSIVSPNRKLYEQKPDKLSHNVCYSIITRNPNVIDKFKNWGVDYRKTCSIQMPNKFEYSFGDFLRGYFDGDGCIYTSSVVKGREYKAVSFTTGSKNFASQLRETLLLYGISTKYSEDSRHNAKYIKIYTKSDILKLKSLMYNNASWFLDRKKIKFDDIV